MPVPPAPRCPSCNGRGWKGSEYERDICELCNGSGSILIVEPGSQIDVDEAIQLARNDYVGDPNEQIPYDLEDIGKHFWATQLALWLMRRHPRKLIPCPACGRRSGRTWNWSIAIRMTPQFRYEGDYHDDDIKYEVQPLVEEPCFTCVNAVTPMEMSGMQNAVRIWAEDELRKFFTKGLHPGFRQLIEVQRRFMLNA